MYMSSLVGLLMDEGPFRTATRQFHFDEHFLRIVLESVAHLHEQSVLITIDSIAFSAS